MTNRDCSASDDNGDPSVSEDEVRVMAAVDIRKARSS